MSLRDKRNIRDRLPIPPEITPARLGDGYGNVRHPTLPNYCYARIAGKVQVIYNDKAPYQNDLLVDCGRDNLGTSEHPVLFKVISTRTTSPGGIGTTVQVGYAPAARYRYFADGGGQDPLWVEGMQIMPLRVGQYSGLTIQIQPGTVYNGTTDLFVPYQALDLTAQLPSAAGKAALVLITVKSDGTIVATKGSEFTLASMTTANLMLANRPAAPALTVRELSLVRVYTGQTICQESRDNTDFTDLRFSGNIPSLVSGGITQLTGPVTAGPGSGSQATTITDKAVTLAKMDDLAQQTVIGRPIGAGTGVPQALTAAQMAAIADVAHLFARVAGDTFTGAVNVNGAFTNHDNANMDMGDLQTSDKRGYGLNYVTDKIIANCVLGNNARNENGAIRVDVTKDPDTLEIYLRGMWQTIIYDMTTTYGDFRHTPLNEQVYIWRGDSVLTAANGRPTIQEYKVSMGANPPAVIINGGSF